jgi:hypothetical protein
MMDTATVTETPPLSPDRTNRRAALWATVVAVPVSALVAYLLVSSATSAGPAARPSPSTARVQATTPVSMAAPTLSERDTPACRALIAQLPDAIRDLRRRPVTAGPEQNAAYGDPAVTVACGTPKPAVPPTADLLIMDGVCWYPAQGREATVFTAIDRETPVQVTVPASYSQGGYWANEFSQLIAGSIRSSPDVPSGCKG